MKKKLVLICTAIIMAVSQIAYSQISIPQPSPSAKVQTTVGLTEVTVDYFRPGMKGRKIFGEGSEFLVPYGQLWRAGANSGSVLKLTTDATIGGQEVKAGEYLIFMTPGANSFEFKLYSDLKIGGNVSAYDATNEVISVSVPTTKLNEKVESLTYQISDISEDNTSANLHFSWENVSVKVPIVVSFDEMVMAQIAKNTKVNPANLLTAANYYLATDKDLAQALAWVNAYLAEGENNKQFWNLHLKARILAKMGEKKQAKAVAEESIELAKAYGNDFGYIKRNQDLIKSL